MCLTFTLPGFRNLMSHVTPFLWAISTINAEENTEKKIIKTWIDMMKGFTRRK